MAETETTTEGQTGPPGDGEAEAAPAPSAEDTDVARTLARDFLEQVSQEPAAAAEPEPEAGGGTDTEGRPAAVQPEEAEAQATPAAELPDVRQVVVGDDVYDYDFVETAVQEAERLAGLSEEVEAELEEVRRTREALQDLEYLLRAVQGRLGDPVFYENLQALLEDRLPQARPQPAAAGEDYGAGEESYGAEAAPRPQGVADSDLIYQKLEERMKQALVPLYASQAHQATERYLADLETRYTIELSPEQRAAIKQRAIERGDFRSDHLFGSTGENPLEKAYFEVVGPTLVEKATRPKESPPAVPEKSRRRQQVGQTSSAALAREFLTALNQ